MALIRVISGKAKIEYPEDSSKMLIGDGTWSDIPDQASKISYDDPLCPTVKSALDKLLYIYPNIISFNLSIGAVEIGSTVNTVIATWTINKAITSISLTDATPNIEDTTFTYSSLNLTNNKTFTLTCGDSQNSVSSSKSITFMNKRYWRSFNSY